MGYFRPTRADQRYTCLAPGRTYRYEGLFRSFVADLDIDGAAWFSTTRRCSAVSPKRHAEAEPKERLPALWVEATLRLQPRRSLAACETIACERAWPRSSLHAP